MTSQSLMRQNQGVLRHARQVLAHPRGFSPRAWPPRREARSRHRAWRRRAGPRSWPRRCARRLGRTDGLALLPEGEPLHLLEYDFRHPVPVSSMSMFGDMHPRTGTGHYYVNGGLTETYQIMILDSFSIRYYSKNRRFYCWRIGTMSFPMRTRLRGWLTSALLRAENKTQPDLDVSLQWGF